MMRFLIALFLLTFSLPAYADTSRVVHDTFKSEREDYLKSSDQMKQQFHDDGVVILKEQAENKKETDKDRAAHQDEMIKAADGWKKDYSDAAADREAKHTQMNAERAEHQAEMDRMRKEWLSDDNAPADVKK